MTVESSPVRKTPWLLIGLGALGVLCLCVIVLIVAVLAFFIPTRVTSTMTEVPPVVIVETGTPLSTTIPAEETQESTDSPVPEAAPAGTAVDIGNDMTLTVLDVTRPVDDATPICVPSAATATAVASPTANRSSDLVEAPSITLHPPMRPKWSTVVAAVPV